MAINRYSLEVIEDSEGIRVDNPQYVFHSKTGNIIFVEDLIKVLKANMPKNLKSDFNVGVRDTLESILNHIGS